MYSNFGGEAVGYVTNIIGYLSFIFMYLYLHNCEWSGLCVLKVNILRFSYQIDVEESFLFLGCCHDDWGHQWPHRGNDV
jgi:hypothetical protein